MDKIDAIRKLREQVEAGSFPIDASARDLGLERFCEDPGLPVINRMCAAFSGSLDAAKSLHDALLPEWFWWVADAMYWANIDADAPCVTLAKGTPGFDLMVMQAHNEDPARAWLIAILRALEAQEGGE